MKKTEKDEIKTRFERDLMNEMQTKDEMKPTRQSKTEICKKKLNKETQRKSEEWIDGRRSMFVFPLHAYGEGDGVEEITAFSLFDVCLSQRKNVE